jgi:hypothetical protein
MNKYLVPIYYIVEAETADKARSLAIEQCQFMTKVVKPAILITDADMPEVFNHTPGI